MSWSDSLQLLGVLNKDEKAEHITSLQLLKCPLFTLLCLKDTKITQVTLSNWRAWFKQRVP